MNKILNDLTAPGASLPVKVVEREGHHSFYLTIQKTTASPISAATVLVQGSYKDTGLTTGVITDVGLAIGTPATTIAHGSFLYNIDGVNYSKSASTSVAMPAGFTISANTFGVVNCYINAAGTVLFGFPLATQAYTSVLSAVNAGRQVTNTADGTPVSSLCYIGRVIIAATTTDWQSNVSNLTNGSGVLWATFNDPEREWFTIQSVSIASSDITAHGRYIAVSSTSLRSIRLVVSSITGGGIINAWYTGL